jgi:hypothetical protein
MAPAPSLKREDILILLAAGAIGPYPLDPVRLMKGAFLVVQRGRPAWHDLFSFEAYDYGPFDRSVYVARDDLILSGLLGVTSGRHDSYELTEEGKRAADELNEGLGPDAKWIRRVGAYVTGRSFSQLLSEIYTAYPQYRDRSIFQ